MSRRPDSEAREPSSPDRRTFLNRSARGLVGAGLAGGATAMAARGAARKSPSTPHNAERGDEAPITSVRAFGATGDGESDDTAAIRKALASNTGGLFFPRGRYRVTEPIVVDLADRGPTSLVGDGTATVVMDGAGPAFHVVGTHDGTANPSTVEEGIWHRQRMPLLDGLEIVGKHEEAVGLRLERTMQAVLSRLAVRHLRHGIHLTRRNRNVIISDVQVYENSGVGIYLDGVNLHQINVTGSHISYNRSGGLVVRNSEVRNLHVGSCDLEANMSENGPPTANILVDARSGSVREGAVTGCTIQHSSDAPRSANVRFLGRKPPVKAGRFTVADNAISDAVVNIHVEQSRGIILTGNHLWMAAGHHLLVEESSHVVCTSTLMEQNPDYGNRPASSDGVTFRDCSDCTISDVHLQHRADRAAHLELERCRGFAIENCLIAGYTRRGIRLQEVRETRIANSTIRPGPGADDKAPAIESTGGQNLMAVHNFLGGPADIATEAATRTGNRKI